MKITLKSSFLFNPKVNVPFQWVDFIAWTLRLKLAHNKNIYSNDIADYIPIEIQSGEDSNFDWEKRAQDIPQLSLQVFLS